MLTIYHNPRCSKSRQTLKLIQDSNQKVTIIEYLKTPLDEQALSSIVAKLDVTVRDIIRTSEQDYKDNNLKDSSLTDKQLLEAIAAMPKLMQRPIVVKGQKAIIGRPPENIIGLLND